jgi:glycerophosphoryl diester phosphodiesterase
MAEAGGRPLVIAHRGAAAEAPENTIAAFELALAQGAELIGLDVRLTRDGHPVVIRDPVLDRTTDGRGPVAARTMRELKRLDAGGWRGPVFRGQRLQSLQEVLERFRERAGFWIELPDAPPGGELEERVLAALEIYDAVERSLLHPAGPESLRRLRAMSETAVLVGRGPGALPPPGLVQGLSLPLDRAAAEELGRVRAAGLAGYVWTVNEPADMEGLLRAGASGLLTERPALLRARRDAAPA